MKAQDLTDKQREIFTKTFYDHLPFSMDETDSPCPWGMPWYWLNNDLVGETIEDMAKNFADEFRDEILELTQEEE